MKHHYPPLVMDYPFDGGMRLRVTAWERERLPTFVDKYAIRGDDDPQLLLRRMVADVQAYRSR